MARKKAPKPAGPPPQLTGEASTTGGGQYNLFNPAKQQALLERLAHDERMLDRARLRLEQLLASAELDDKAALRAFATLARIIDRRRESTLPAIAEARECETMVQCFQKAAIGLLGLGHARKLAKLVCECYEQETLKERQAAERSQPGEDAGRKD